MDVLRSKLFVVPTDRAENSLLLYPNGTWNHEKGLMTQEYLNSIKCKSYHLYFTTKSDILVGDWYIESTALGNFLRLMTEKDLNAWKQEYNIDSFTRRCTKIVATTNKNLYIQLPNQCDGCIAGIPKVGGVHRSSEGALRLGQACSEYRYRTYYPQPSKGFLDKWIKSPLLISTVKMVLNSEGHIKVDSHNTISILKDEEVNYTIDEVQSFISDFAKDISKSYNLNIKSLEHFSNNWINNTLFRDAD